MIIYGDFSSLFHGMTLSKEARKEACKQMVGTTVKDENGVEIGKIICVDTDNCKWYAKVDNFPKTDLYVSSMEIINDA